MIKLKVLFILSIGSLALSISSLKAAEDDLYDFLWLDPDKKVYVLQNKVYQKRNTFYANLGYLKNTTSRFQDTSGINISAGYYLHEEFALEFKYSQYNNSNNEDFNNIQTINGSTPFIIRPNRTLGASLVWSPFYGKINTFNKIIYLDWSFGLGVGQINTESNARTAGDENQADIFDEQTDIALLTKTALRIHVTKRVHFNLEYQKDFYKAPGPLVNGNQNESIRSNTDFILSVGFSF